jgi:hypothetical protein
VIGRSERDHGFDAVLIVWLRSGGDTLIIRSVIG